MTPSDAAAHHALLLEQRARLVAEGDVPVTVERGTPVASDTDEDEAPYLEMGQAIASARNRERAERLVHIDDALRRLKDDPDGFGECEGCGEDIPARRLALMPWARLCVACQSEREDKPGAAVRKKVTDYR